MSTQMQNSIIFILARLIERLFTRLMESRQVVNEYTIMKM